MSQLVVPQEGQTEFMTDVKTALAAVITATKLKVHLYTNNYTPIGSTTITDFTEATFTGYAAQNVPALGVVFTNDSGQAEFDCTATSTWTATDAVTPNTIYGYYVVDSTTGTIVRWAERFDTPVDMTAAGKTLILLLRLLLASMF